MIESTWSWEKRVEEAYEQTFSKYKCLAKSCRERSWKAWVFSVKDGFRGFPA